MAAKMVKTVADAAMFVLTEVEPLLRSVVDLASCIEAKGERFPAAARRRRVPEPRPTATGSARRSTWSAV
jgi:hypothetical protein